MKFFFFIFCFSFLSLFIYADNEIQDPSTGVVFPSEVSFEYNGKEFHLQATGVSTRKKFFVKVYSIASYLEKRADTSGNILQAIMQTDQAKQLTMKWVHEASIERVRNGYQESFQNTLTSDQYGQLRNEIETFISFFSQAVQKGDEHILRSLPGGVVDVIINGRRVGSIPNQEFAKALWSLWFGEKSVVNRDQLLK